MLPVRKFQTHVLKRLFQGELFHGSFNNLLNTFPCIGEGNSSPLQCSCLENPRDGGAWWAAVYRVSQSRTRLMRLSSSSSNSFVCVYMCDILKLLCYFQVINCLYFILALLKIYFSHFHLYTLEICVI